MNKSVQLPSEMRWIQFMMPLAFTPNTSGYQAFVQGTLNEFHVALTAIYTAGVVEKTTKLDYFLRLAVGHTYVRETVNIGTLPQLRVQ